MGRSGATDAINGSRWPASLCRKMNRSAPERRIPSIIELWLSASEKIAQSGSSLPSVPSAARFEIHPDVKVTKLGLELDMVPVGPGDVSRSAGASAEPKDGIVHGGQHIGMLPHSEVVVAAPHGDAAAPAVAAAQQRGRELPRHPLQLDEGPGAAGRPPLPREDLQTPHIGHVYT